MSTVPLVSHLEHERAFDAGRLVWVAVEGGTERKSAHWGFSCLCWAANGVVVMAMPAGRFEQAPSPSIH